MTVAISLCAFICHHNKQIVIGSNTDCAHILIFVTRLCFSANTSSKSVPSNTLEGLIKYFSQNLNFFTNDR